MVHEGLDVGSEVVAGGLEHGFAVGDPVFGWGIRGVVFDQIVLEIQDEVDVAVVVLVSGDGVVDGGCVFGESVADVFDGTGASDEGGQRFVEVGVVGSVNGVVKQFVDDGIDDGDVVAVEECRADGVGQKAEGAVGVDFVGECVEALIDEVGFLLCGEGFIEEAEVGDDADDRKGPGERAELVGV